MSKTEVPERLYQIVNRQILILMETEKTPGSVCPLAQGQ
jgi:hypothetical protein